MKDKEKQIEEKLEMARIIAFDLCPSGKHHNGLYREPLCYSNDNFGECLKIKNVVDNLYNAGYRKIPEDSVVLTKGEYELWNILKKTWASDDKEVSAEDMLETLKNTKELGSKETAEKILKEIYCKSVKHIKGKELSECFIELSFEQFDELARFIGVEIKE